MNRKPPEDGHLRPKDRRGIQKNKEGKLYKYYYGDTSNYTEIERKLQEAKSKGYKTAYIVAFKNGIKQNANEFINKS